MVAYLRKSSWTFLVNNYLLTLLLKSATKLIQTRSTQFDQTNKRMNKHHILNTIKFIGKSILVLLTGILIFAYSIALIEKIQRPTFKNLPTNEFVIIGIILLILIFVNLKWVFGIFKTKLNEK